ncbi:MAG: DUF1854 domain-containing protein [Lentisphaerae bacterium]|nr:DUF1854 domain-containing protein [Lentisphaerota bacterium]
MNELDPKQVIFATSDEGELGLTLADGTRHTPIQCSCLFPLSDPEHYISIQQGDDKHHPEIGIIKDLSALLPEQRQLIDQDLKHQHFLPEILSIEDIRGLHGIDEWCVTTDRGPITFFVSGRKSSIVLTNDNLLLVTDIEKCRYRITDYTTLPLRARQMLERALP